jgi:DNA (cytosine-5)-methyltransferase 1
MKAETGLETVGKTEFVNPRTTAPSTEKALTKRYNYDADEHKVSRVVVIKNREIVTTLSLGTIELISTEECDAQELFDRTYLRLAEPIESNETGKTIPTADIFSGCGGLSLGIREACVATGNIFSSTLAIDNDSRALEIYKKNFNPTKHSSEGIWDLISGELGDNLRDSEKELLEGLPQTKILLAGPPCQGHSNLNNHTRRKDDRNHLYQRVGRFAEIAKPDFILVENVPAVIHDQDNSMLKTQEFLIGLGYEVDQEMVNLVDLGVPQRRKRHVLVAALRKKFSIRDIVKKYKVTQERTVRWAIDDLEDENVGIFDTSAVVSDENKKRIEYLLNEDIYDLPNNLRPPCHQDGKHSYYAMYGRLNYDISAPTITTGFNSPGQGRYVHPSRKRTLTPHEAARLQFFPDFFDFTTAETRRTFSKTIGNAVPMKLSYIFGLEFMAEI